MRHAPCNLRKHGLLHALLRRCGSCGGLLKLHGPGGREPAPRCRDACSRRGVPGSRRWAAHAGCGPGGRRRSAGAGRRDLGRWRRPLRQRGLQSGAGILLRQQHRLSIVRFSRVVQPGDVHLRSDAGDLRQRSAVLPGRLRDAPPPVCDATTCTGCCNGTTCVDLSTQGATQCGKAGAMCGSCGSSTPVCQAGACINPCATVTCNQPPAAICLNATTVETYAATGTCDPLTGGCTYATSTSACTNGQQCAQGACVTPPPQCNANNCTGCCSGTTCVATANESAAACGSGGAACVSCGSATPVCQSGACVDLCVGVTCNQLPAPFCFDTHTVESYVTPGTCAPATGTCTYVPSQVPCGAGQVCQSGACVAQAADSGYNFIFVAPPTVAPEFFGGLAGADALCQAAAQDAGLPGTYLAWLSTSTVNAKDRFTAARGWVRPDGLPFADSMASLTALQNFYPPALDAHGKNVGAIILPTGTLANGLKTSLTCLNWTGYQEMSGPGGYPQAGAGQWTDARTTEALCARPGALYCLGIDHNTPLTFAPAAGRRMFLSTPWIPSGGLAGADAHCASDAAAANVTGTFQALLATSTASAGSRFAPGNWVRLDGVSVGDMTTGPLTAPPLLSSTGAYTASSYAWTGAALPTAVALGAAYTCQDWTAAAGSLVDVGTPDTSAAGFFFGSQATCASTLVSLYCLEP